MKKHLLFFMALAATGLVNAQVVDTVSMGPDYANDIYYTLSSGAESASARNNWDLAFASDGLGGASSTIRINGGEGVELYLYSKDTADWNTLDTTGFAWSKQVNTDTSWSVGAFENTTLTSALDLGWGSYNMVTHIVEGDRIFILKYIDATYKKLIVKSLKSGVYTIQFADLDGSNETTATIDKSDYAGKNFGYYSLKNKAEADREPSTSSWDLVFTKYVTQLAPMTYYPVTGVLANNDVKVAQVNDVPDMNTVSHFGQTFNTEINTIGYDWKTFNMGTFQYDIQDSLVYFAEDLNGDVYKLIFTGFGGSMTGDFIFSKEKVGSTSVEEAATAQILDIYPNPATDRANLTFTNTGDAAQLMVFDMTGKQVWSQNLNGGNGLTQTSIDVSSLNAGVYFVTLFTTEGKATQKLIVQ